MSVNPTQFDPGPTRDVQQGDTPDLNDGLLSREAAVDDIGRGELCLLIDGLVTVATDSLDQNGNAIFVPIESVANSGDDNLPISGVTAPQRVALRAGADSNITFHPGDYGKISNVAGVVEPMATADANTFRVVRYLGKEAALLDRNASDPFDETLSVGIVPDQDLVIPSGEFGVGWFQLVERQGTFVIP